MRYISLLLSLPLFAYAYDNAKMLCLVNKQRAAAGLSPLGLSARLTQAAQGHSDDQARMRLMSHSGSDGSKPGVRIQSAGYQWQAVAENVAFGYGDEEKCMKEWMNSPGHRQNILGPYTHFGSAVAYSGSTPYYTQDFGADGDDGDFPMCPDGSEYYDNVSKHGRHKGRHGHSQQNRRHKSGHANRVSVVLGSNDDTMTFMDGSSNGWQNGKHFRQHRNNNNGWSNGWDNSRDTVWDDNWNNGGMSNAWGGGFFQRSYRH